MRPLIELTHSGLRRSLGKNTTFKSIGKALDAVRASGSEIASTNFKIRGNAILDENDRAGKIALRAITGRENDNGCSHLLPRYKIRIGLQLLDVQFSRRIVPAKPLLLAALPVIGCGYGSF